MRWQEFVKKVRADQKIASYKEALKVASPLWKELKQSDKGGAIPDVLKKKARKQRKVRFEAPEVEEYPKPKKARRVRKKVARTETTAVTDMGGYLSEAIPAREGKIRGRKRIRKRNSVVLDSASKFAARKSKVTRV